MTVEEMIKKYRISACGNDKIRVSDSQALIKDNAEAEVKARKPEILAYFAEKSVKEKKVAEERAAKIAAIEGLETIRKAKADMASWNYEFSKSFEGENAVGGFGVRAKPEYDFDALYAQYPIARDFLKAEKQANKNNYELSEIGEKALEAIIENPVNHESIIAEMEEEIKAFVERHMFD